MFLANIHPIIAAGSLGAGAETSSRRCGHDELLDRRDAQRAGQGARARGYFAHQRCRSSPATDEYNLVKAAEKVREMGPKTIVIKRGEYGVLLFGGDGQRFAAPAFPLDTVFDPTGAGDSFGGGFLGHIANRGSTSDEVLRQAIVFGNVMGSFCVEDLGTRRLQGMSREQIMDRYREFKRLTHFEDIN